LSRAAELWAKISPGLANRPGSALFSRGHAWLVRRSGGRLKNFIGVEVLILRTTGRRSGKPRESPMFFLEHGDGYAVVASNAAASRTPAWWLNLQAHPDAEAFVSGRSLPVRGREATPQEAESLWPRFDALYGGYERYREISSRDLPVVILEPRAH
jgi:deazaflavin-dependent oxidoreductase (nitroreductase family)